MAKKNKKRNFGTAVTAGIGLAAGLAATTIGVACLTVFYMRSLMGVDYIADEDVYEDEN